MTLEEKRAYERLRYKRRKESSLCQRCNNPVVPGRAYCEKHLIYQKKSVQKRRDKRKKNGLCVECDMPVSGGIRCAKHALSDNNWHKKCRKKRLNAVVDFKIPPEFKEPNEDEIIFSKGYIA
ncbi:MAG: hypothetical protein GY853_13570 [PVC group bacterium]|nr:hypothetical protein [PVC group bacterium]